jgi:uncharacterized coiled-coil DUF342 family protein
MRLDAADLALLEIDSEKLEPLGRGLVRVLLEQIRYLQDDAEDARIDHESQMVEMQADMDRADTEADDAKEALVEARKRAEEMRVFLSNVRSEAAHASDLVDRITDP